jgi:ABC-type oligopeptide transport system substrate-binding subunit
MNSFRKMLILLLGSALILAATAASASATSSTPVFYGVRGGEFTKTDGSCQPTLALMDQSRLGLIHNRR